MTVSLVKDEITRDGETFVRVSALAQRAFNLRTEVRAFTGHRVDYVSGVGMVWTDDDAPTPGDRCSYGDLTLPDTYPADADSPRYVTLPFTDWSDYSGATYTRSNYRSLLRDFPGTFVDVYGSHGYSGLALDMSAYIPEHLADCLHNLADEYPVYDESDMSELETELQTEGWANHGREDFRREVVSHLRNLGWLGSVGVDADDLAESITDDQLDRLFWDAYSNGEHRVTMECEDAVSAYFRTDDLAAFVARSLAVRGLAGVA